MAINSCDIKEIKDLFHSGSYLEVVDRVNFLSSQIGRSKEDLDTLPYVTGALTFLGRTNEAESRLKSALDSAFSEASTDAAVEARFYLVVGLYRSSRSDQARTYQNANESAASRPDASALTRFFTLQGKAIIHYFSGSFLSANQFAMLAHAAAVESHSPWARLLATDLLGQSFVQVGKAHSGLQHLKEGMRISKALKNQATSRALKIASLLVRSQNGIQTEKILSEFEATAKKLRDRDNYSTSTLLLEMAHFYTLTGDFLQADEALNRAGSSIFTYQLARQESLLYFRMSELNYLRGKSIEALGMARMGLRVLDPQGEKSLALQGLGLELKITRELGYKSEVIELEKRIQSLSGSNSDFSHRHRKILARETSSNPESFDPNQKEDWMCGLLDQIAREKSGRLSRDFVRRALDANLPTFLFQHPRGLRRGKREIRFDLAPNRIILSCPVRGISVVTLGRKKTPLRILDALLRGIHTKEALFAEIWRQKFSSHLHNQVVTNAVQITRKLLGRFEDWIITTEQGYRLNSTLSVATIERSEGLTERPLQKGLSGHLWDPRLNFRQHSCLSQLKADETVTVPEYRKLFSVSTMTAFRDLNELKTLNLIKRRGKARLVRYSRA